MFDACIADADLTRIVAAQRARNLVALGFDMAMALQEAAKKAQPVLLEPIMKVEVQAPEEFIRKYPNMDPQGRLTAYYAAVTAMDAAIGEVLGTSEETEL